MDATSFSYVLSGSGKMKKAKEWGVPTVSVQWLNEVLFGGVTGAQCLKNPRFQNFKMEDSFRIDYTMVPSLISAWKHPIRVTPVSWKHYDRSHGISPSLTDPYDLGLKVGNCISTICFDLRIIVFIWASFLTFILMYLTCSGKIRLKCRLVCRTDLRPTISAN